MRFSLTKALKDTHRHPFNKILHVIGLLLYVMVILVILGNIININVNRYITSLFLFIVAISLFLLGHKIEGNIRATTWVILFKFLRESIRNKMKPLPHRKN